MKTYTLLDNMGYYTSVKKGLFGGYSRRKIYGKMDCPSALRAIKNGGYVKYRVFLKQKKMQLLVDTVPVEFV